MALSINREEPPPSDSDAVWIALHAIASLIVGPVIVFMVVGIADGIFGNSPLKPIFERGGLANPFIWGPGFVLGFLVNRIISGRFACWVWPLGVVWLAYGIWDSVHLYDPRWYQGCSASENVVNAFFILNSRKCGGGSSTLAGILFTLPAVNTIAYSLGAWLGLLSKRRWDRTDSKRHTTTLGLS